MNIPGDISKAFVDELFGIISPKDAPNDVFTCNPEAALKIMVNKLIFLGEINEIEKEINIILSRLGMTNKFLIKTYSIEELVIGVKHYLIAWSTMKDLMTSFINVCFDLGIHETDISFGVVIRNKKIVASKIPDICKKHEKLINVKYTDKQRNDAIHRGKLLDDEINELKSCYSKLYSRKYSLLTLDPISDHDFKTELSKLNSDLKNIAESKRKEYSAHFERTMELNKEIARELAKQVANEILQQKI